MDSELQVKLGVPDSAQGTHTSTGRLMKSVSRPSMFRMRTVGAMETESIVMASVATSVTCAGKQPDGYPKNPDPALFFDFVSAFTTAAETLPECIRRVDRIIEWRAANPD